LECVRRVHEDKYSLNEHMRQGYNCPYLGQLLEDLFNLNLATVS
jgi:hypothetical protein